MLQNGASHICACVNTKCQRGVSHHFGAVLTSLEKYRAIWGTAAIVSHYRTTRGHYKPSTCSSIDEKKPFRDLCTLLILVSHPRLYVQAGRALPEAITKQQCHNKGQASRDFRSNANERRTNVQQLTCKMGCSFSFYYRLFSLRLFELKQQ